MAHNRYVRNGKVSYFDDPMSGARGAILFGDALFDPNAIREPSCIPPHQMGRPHEMILYIAGVMYYPTPQGYVLIEQKGKP